MKRVRAVAAHVEQLTRYCERVDLDPAHGPCRGILVAPEIAPQARVMCEARGFAFVALDYDVLKGDAAPELTLFERHVARPEVDPHDDPPLAGSG